MLTLAAADTVRGNTVTLAGFPVIGVALPVTIAAEGVQAGEKRGDQNILGTIRYTVAAVGAGNQLLFFHSLLYLLQSLLLIRLQCSSWLKSGERVKKMPI